MKALLRRYICVGAWLVFTNSLFAQGVLGTNPSVTTNVTVPFVEISFVSNNVAPRTNSAAEATVSRSVGALEEIISRSVELPGTAPRPRPLDNPSVSALRTAILALGGIVIVPCLIGACVMIAKEHRRAARICVIAAAIVGGACLLALIMVDSMG